MYKIEEECGSYELQGPQGCWHGEEAIEETDQEQGFRWGMEAMGV